MHLACAHVQTVICCEPLAIVRCKMLGKSFSFLFPLFLLLNVMMFCVNFSLASFLNRYCQFQLLLHGLFSSVQCMLGICQFSTPSCVELDVLTLCLLREDMKEIHCISLTSYVVGQHSTVASSTGRPCRGSSFPAGKWQ